MLAPGGFHCQTASGMHGNTRLWHCIQYTEHMHGNLCWHQGNALCVIIRMYVCMYVYIYIYIYIYIYTHVCVHTCARFCRAHDEVLVHVNMYISAHPKLN